MNTVPLTAGKGGGGGKTRTKKNWNLELAAIHLKG